MNLNEPPMKVDEPKSNPAPITGGDTPPRSSIAGISRVRSDALLGRRGELIIEHAGREYRLRQTSTGKLILTA